MKRSMLTIQLPVGQPQMTIQIPQPGIIHRFDVMLRAAAVVTELNRGAEVVPCILVEVDPTNLEDKGERRPCNLIMIRQGQIIDTPGKLTYIGSAILDPSNILHLFEEVIDAPEQVQG